MKRLIKRYVLKAQVDSENDEINEGENDSYPLCKITKRLWNTHHSYSCKAVTWSCSGLSDQ